MKKSTVNILLIVGAAAAAFFIIKTMRRRLTSTVEAGPTQKITEEEFETAEVVEQPTPGVLPVQPQSILNVIKSLKRTPEQKAAAQQRKLVRKKKRTEKKAVTGFDDISVLY